MSLLWQKNQKFEWQKALLHYSYRRQFPKKASIIDCGDKSDTLYYLLDGSTSEVIGDDDGNEIVLRYLFEGDFFGEIGLFSEESQYETSVVARKECEVAAVSYDAIMKVIDQHPEMMFALASHLVRQLHKTTEKVHDLAFLDVTGRVASTLLDLAKNPDSISHREGRQIRLTQQEIARIVGCSRQKVGATLRDFESRGLIHVRGGTMLICGVE